MYAESQTLRRARQLEKMAQELVARLEEEDERDRAKRGPSLSESEGFITLRQFLRELGLSHTAYQNMRRAGKMPPEIRLSKRTIRFSKAEIAKWRDAGGGMC
jgi:predicted DNA-binding transcriptional regulator AlpA